MGCTECREEERLRELERQQRELERLEREKKEQEAAEMRRKVSKSICALSLCNVIFDSYI